MVGDKREPNWRTARKKILLVAGCPNAAYSFISELVKTFAKGNTAMVRKLLQVIPANALLAVVSWSIQRNGVGTIVVKDSSY